MKAQTHILESLAMDLAGSSLKIGGHTFPIGTITLDPGNRAPGDQPVLLLPLHTPAGMEQTCPGGVREFTAPQPAGPDAAPARDRVTELLTTGKTGDITLAGVTIKEDKATYRIVVISPALESVVVGDGPTPHAAASHVLELLGRISR